MAPMPSDFRADGYQGAQDDVAASVGRFRLMEFAVRTLFGGLAAVIVLTQGQDLIASSSLGRLAP